MVANAIVMIETVFSSSTRDSFGYALQRSLAKATTSTDWSVRLVYVGAGALTVLVYKAARPLNTCR